MSDHAKSDGTGWVPNDPWIHMVIEGEEEVNFAKYNLTAETYRASLAAERDPSERGKESNDPTKQS